MTQPDAQPDSEVPSLPLPTQEALDERLRRLHVILDDVQAYALARRPFRIFRRLTEGVLEILPGDGVLLLLHYPSAGFAHLTFGAGAVPPRPQGWILWPFLKHLTAEGQVTLVTGPECQHFQEALSFTPAEVLIAPVQVQASVTGALLVTGKQANTFQPQDLALAASYASTIALTLVGTQVVQDLVHLLTITRGIAEAQDLDTVLHRVLEYATALTNTEAASILLQETRTGKLAFAAAIGPKTAKLESIRVPVDSIAGRAVRENRAVVVQDTRASPEHFRLVDEAVGFETRSLMAVPIQWHGQTIGALEVLNKCEGAFDSRDLDLLQTLASQAAVLIQNARLATEREQAFQELKELDERKTQFIALTSHELRTPLTIVRGHAEMLAEELQGTPLAGFVQGVLEGTRQLTEVMEEITAMSRAEDPKELEEVAPVDVRRAVQVALLEVENWARVKQHDVVAHMPDEPVTVLGNLDLLQEAILQLINNAVKFTPEGGRITVRVEEEEAYAVITVSDTGPGIPPEEHSRIFQRFYQGESYLDRVHPGLGLGLAITKAVVEQHGGQVWVDSDVGRGATFTVILPLEGTPPIGRAEAQILAGRKQRW